MKTQIHHVRVRLFGVTAVCALAATGIGGRFPSIPQSAHALADVRAADTACAVPPDTMIGWWPFDSLQSFDVIDGLGFRDKAGANNVGAPVGEPIAPMAGAYVGNSIALNGRDEYIRVADHPELAFGAGDLTIDAWIRIDPADPGTGRRPIVAKSAPGPMGPPYGFALFLEDGHLGFTLSGLSAPLADIVSAAPVKDGWHFVAVTVERAANPLDAVATLYINNNTPERFAVASSTETVDNTADLLIGSDIPGLDRQAEETFWGEIDEVELFRRALTPAEIGAIYTSGSAGKCKKPGPQAQSAPSFPTVLGVEEIVNIDVVNECAGTADGFRFVLSGFSPLYTINGTNYPFPDLYEIPCPNASGAPECNRFIGTPTVPVYTAGVAGTGGGAGTPGNIVLEWGSTAAMGQGQTSHFGYTLGTGYGHDVRAQLLTALPVPAMLCESVAYSTEWTGTAVTMTLTLENRSRDPLEVVARGMVSQRMVSLRELVPSNGPLMRALGDPERGTVLAPGERQAVTVEIGAADRAIVMLADWYAYDGQRGARKARAFHARSLNEAPAVPAARRYFPWAGNNAFPGAPATNAHLPNSVNTPGAD